METDGFMILEEGSSRILTGSRNHRRHLVIPASVTEIGAYAFRRDFSLEEVEIPSSVRIIGAEAFSGCIGLKKILFHEGLRQIEMRAFWACSSLTQVFFPQTLRYIGPRAFESCSMLQTITLSNPDTQTSEDSFRETPYFRDQMESAIRFMSSVRENADEIGPLRLPEGVTHIDNWGFARAKITSAWLPNSLRTMGMSAFKNCTMLRKVSMSPNTYCNYTLDIDSTDGIFSGCTALEEVYLRGPLEQYLWEGQTHPVLLRGFDPDRTFLHCTELRYITAPKVPLDAFPPAWIPYALNGFLSDKDRNAHFPPEIAEQYHARLRDMRLQLIARTELTDDPALYQYLMEQNMILEDEVGLLIENAHHEPEITAELLEYRRSLASRTHSVSFLDRLEI